MSDDTTWDRDARATLAAIIRQTPMAQLPKLMPSIVSAAVEVADAIAKERNTRTVEKGRRP